jgi:hypothetical protein
MRFFLTFSFLLPFAAFAQSDSTITVMVRPSYTVYRQPTCVMCGSEQYLIQEASFEGAVFDTTTVVITLKEAFWSAKEVMPKWKKKRKKLVIPPTKKGAKKQKICYDYMELVRPPHLDSVFVPAFTKTIQRYTIRIQGDTTKPNIPGIYGTIISPKCHTTALDIIGQLQVPAEYKKFIIQK